MRSIDSFAMRKNFSPPLSSPPLACLLLADPQQASPQCSPTVPYVAPCTCALTQGPGSSRQWLPCCHWAGRALASALAPVALALRPAPPLDSPRPRASPLLHTAEAMSAGPLVLSHPAAAAAAAAAAARLPLAWRQAAAGQRPGAAPQCSAPMSAALALRRARASQA